MQDGSPSFVLTPAEAADIISRLRPGESFAYFLGNIAFERAQYTREPRRKKDKSVKKPRVYEHRARLTPRALAISTLAQYMMCQTNCELKLSDGKLVSGCGSGILTQQKISSGIYLYQFKKVR